MNYRKVNLIKVGEEKYLIIIEIIYFKIGFKEMSIYRNEHSIYLPCDFSPCDAGNQHRGKSTSNMIIANIKFVPKK